MNITFEPLASSHFPLLLKWLETPHVKAWWDRDVVWTLELIRQKYSSYIKGYKLEKDKPKEIHAFIICYDKKPIGYIQIYNAHDFSRKTPLIALPQSLAGFDILIGEPEYIGQGIGPQALRLFLDTHCDKKFTHVFANPNSDNIAAINGYGKAGFKKIKKDPNTNEIWMLREQ